jgi:uncharacterized delta-60 repeat protein
MQVRRPRSTSALALVACCVALAAVQPSGAATSNTTVGANILAATNLDTSGCPSLAANITNFGNVVAGSSNVTAADCSVTWGSTNETAMLRVYQEDGIGSAFWRPPDGSLDSSFGTGGKVTNGVGNDDDVLTGLVRQPDGKIVAGGWTYNVPGDGYTDAMLLRYNADGTLDGGFGTGGKAVDHPIAFYAEDIMAVALQADGRIVATGQSSNGNMSVWRYTAAGALDTTFSGDGRVEVPGSSNVDDGRSIIVQPDGKVLVSGYWQGTVQYDAAVARFNTDGTLDTTFNGTGYWQSGMAASADRAYAMALQPDGKILIAGYAKPGANDDFAVARLTTTGALDTTFNGTGVAVVSLTAGFDDAYAIALQPDGKIVVAGAANGDFGLARFNANGSLDTSFDGDGMQTTPIGTGTDTAKGVTILSDGRIAAAGWSTTANNDFAVVRYLANGSLDTSFNTTGKQSTTIGSAHEWANAMIAGQDGTYILAGTAWTGAYPAGYDAALVRYASLPVADYAGGSNWSAGSNTFGACLRAVSGTGVAGTWTVNATCPATDGAYWNPIPATSGAATSKIAQSTTAGTANATAAIRFGFRVSNSQGAGTYLAPIVFEVQAPNV